ncbi:DUF4101 domain-containing protein [Trichocoleus sp. FACHB-591]|uniref:IMS domain-containing protein n=1 Tax=Trichocoleus sp. FACHB-591 TaxID=2692872 RepID=UPI001681CCFF|nr:IMS domain-containing protein [Trichocoleus sp. FACHB-591]MBD2096805.1 DUF4101 domain-containing protein [Trichocoleus sp. FACHB-591]
MNKRDRKYTSQGKKNRNLFSKEINQEAVKNISADGNSKIHIEGIHQHVGDVYETINHHTRKHGFEFFKRTNLKTFTYPYFPSLTCLDEIIESLYEDQIVVIGGSHPDKLPLALHLAVNLQESTFTSTSSEIYEWESTSDSKGLIAAIREEINGIEPTDKEVNRIFVLFQLSHQNVELSALRELVDEHKIFIIATTENPYEKWSLSQSENRLWLDSNHLSYEPDVLAESAIERIPEGITISVEMKAELRTLVAEKLSTVAAIDICIDWLRVCKKPISSSDLDAAIQNAKEDKKERLKRWFRTLSSREQLLAIGVSLFNGLYTDQFFAALERVVENVWQQRDPSLRALDHCDLENLGNYCEFSEVTKGDDFVLRRLNVKDPEAGKLLLCIAWESHRRQIITALEEIIEIIDNSAQENFPKLSDYQLYGNDVLRERLYEGTSRAFADVGLVTAEATAPVRDLLITLASNNEFIVQDFVATVLAYWYQGDSDKFLRTLRFFYDFSTNSLSNQEDSHSLNRRDYVGATVALAISYASLNDPPNQLHPHLCDWLVTLSNSKNPLIRVYFALHTLGYVVPEHLLQIHPILKEIAERQSDLSLAIADSLATAYNNYPDEVPECLKAWTQDRTKITLLCAVARTYGLINCGIYPSNLTPEFAFEQLSSLLRDEKRITVREAVIEGMSNRLKQNCLIIAPMLLKQVAKFTKSERNQFVSHLTKIYLAQRAELTGGEGFCEVNKVRYRIWINTNRPATEIENILLQWLGQSQNRTAQQIATQAAIEFAKALDIGEETELNRLRSLKSSSVHQDEDVQFDNQQPWHDNWLAPVAAWLVTLQEKVYQPVVQNILPEALIHHEDHRAGMNFVLRKWEQSPKQFIGDAHSLRLKPTATALRRGLWVMDNKVPLMLVGVGASVLGVMTIQTAGQAVGNQITSLLPRTPKSGLSYPDNPSVARVIDGGISMVDAVGVQDKDSPNFDQGELQVKFTVNSTPDDLLSILNKGREVGQIGVSGNQVLYSGKLIGSFTEGTSEKPLRVALNSEATPEAVQALLQNVAYKHKSPIVTPDFRTVQFILSDGNGGVSKPLTRNISLIAKNQIPTIVAPESLKIRESSALTYGKVEISDPDSKIVTVQLSSENGIIAVKGDIPKGLKTEEIGGNNSKIIELKGSLEKIKATFANPSAITYKPNTDFAGDDSLKITVIDDGPTIQEKTASLVWPPEARQPQEASKVIKISVIPRNQFPIINLPDSKAVNEDNDLSIVGISIKDPDSKGDKEPVTVTLNVQNGSLKVKPNVADGLKADSINGNSSPDLTLKGTIAAINATLADPAAITYSGRQDYSGTDSLNIRVDDGGRGAEAALSITINPVNDAPEIGASQPVQRAPEALSSTSSQSGITQAAALDTIRSYLQAKREIFAPPFSRELAARYTTGVLYNDIVQRGKAIDSLSQKNQYYQYGNQQTEFLGGFRSSSDKAFINVLITEEVTLYENGSIKNAARNNPKSYQFELRLENGAWKIFDYKDFQ